MNHKLFIKFFLLLAIITSAPLSHATNHKNNHGKLKIVTSFNVLADFVQSIGGNLVEVKYLIKKGANIHSYKPTPLDLIKTRGADLFVYNGLNLEVWWKKFMQRQQEIPSLELAKGVQSISIYSGQYKNTPNPHAWLNPKALKVYSKNLVKKLQQLDPKNAKQYQINADNFNQEVTDIFRYAKKKLGTVKLKQRILITSEGAFSYLAAALGFQELYLWAINSEQQSEPKHIKFVIDKIKKHQIPVIFSESTVSHKPAQEIAKQTNIKWGGVLYVDSLTDKDGLAPSLLHMIEHNLNLIINGFILQ